MEHRSIGELSVSVVGLGCNNFGRRIDATESAVVVGAALDAGIDYFDTADAYGDGQSEEFLGNALGRNRDDVVIATKFGSTGSAGDGVSAASAVWVAAAVEASLERLGTDRIDHYQLHMPDDAVGIDETLGALDELVRAGKVREVGCSNFSAAQIAEAAVAADEESLAPFRSCQNRYSVLYRRPEADVLHACQEHGLGFIPYFPLESGLLTGKYVRGEKPPEGTRLAGLPDEGLEHALRDDKMDKVEALAAYGAANDRTLVDLAISWLLAQPAVVSVIAGATKPDQVTANASAADWSLDSGDLVAIDTISAWREGS